MCVDVTHLCCVCLTEMGVHAHSILCVRVDVTHLCCVCLTEMGVHAHSILSVCVDVTHLCLSHRDGSTCTFRSVCVC